MKRLTWACRGAGCALGMMIAAGPALAGETVALSDDLDLTWNLRATAGAAARVEDRDKDLLFAGDTPGGRAQSAVSDDGNLNYDKGDFVTGVLQGYGSIDLKYKNVGAFVSGKAWYDHVQDDKSVPHGHYPNGYAPDQSLYDQDFDKRAQFSGGTVQQAYVYGDFELNGHDLNAKLGDQLLLWGRSLFSRASFSSLNAIDLAALHRPGSQYTEYLVPAGMATFDYDLTDSLNLQAFYQYDWQKAVVDGCGTYYSSYDNVATGCNATFSSSTVVDSQTAYNQGLYYRRDDDHDADDGGQYGFKLNYAFERAKANLGAYFFNYNMRLPIYSVRKHSNPAPTPDAPGAYNAVNYYYEYPEDIQVFGLTADKTFESVGNLALNLSYIPDMPLQINTPDLTTQAVTSSLGAPSNANIPQGTQAYINGYGLGDEVQGYREYDVERAELTFTTIIPQLLGADRTIVSVQNAFEYIPDLPDTEDIRFRRHTNFGVGGPDEEGYVTDFSWGYQAAVISTYKDAIGAVTLKPGITYRHGVDGYSSDDALQENQRTLTLSLGMEYENLAAELSYTNYSDAKYSVVKDRDYVAFSTTYNF